MRCIEIMVDMKVIWKWRWINYNMRCIEILKDRSKSKGVCSDKLQHEMYWNAYPHLETIPPTSDKLQHEMYWNANKSQKFLNLRIDKLQHEMYWNDCIDLSAMPTSVINYNMRCIEINNHFLFTLYLDDKLQHEMYWNMASCSNPSPFKR